MKTAMQEFIIELETYLNLDQSITSLKLQNFINEKSKQRLLDESKQIENAYNNGKYYPYNDCDGSKYYFMTYITND